jgi:CheY-like chemotaxis protein
MKDRKGPPGGEGHGKGVLGERPGESPAPARTHPRLRADAKVEAFPPRDTETPQPPDSYSRLLVALSTATEELDAALADVQDGRPNLRRHASGEHAAPPLVLIVDDNEDLRELYSQTLRGAGYRTAMADNGRAAIEKALALRPQAIVLDYWMPVMDGAGAARILRADARTCRIPLILVTAIGAPPEAVLAVPCRPKPDLPDDVVSAVRAALDSSTDEECG